METRECNTYKNILQIYSDFMLNIAKFEELVTHGRKLILDFQQGLEFISRPPLGKRSALVNQIIESNKTKRLSSYLEAGRLQDDGMKNMSRLHLSHLGLLDHLIKGKCIVDELEGFLLDATTEVVATENLYSDDKVSSVEKVICDRTDWKYDYADYAAAMAVLYTMIKQDYEMQERMVSSLGLKSSSEELESYSMMWSLRPFIDENFIISAWKLVL